MGCTLGVAFSTPGTHPAGARTRYQGRATIGMSVRTTDGLVAGRNRTPTTLRSPRCRCFDDDARLALVRIIRVPLDDRLLGCPCGSHGSEGCKGLASIRAVSIGSLTRQEPRRSGGFDSRLDALRERVGVLGRGPAGEADQ